VLRESHGIPSSGHMGFFETSKKIWDKFLWRMMKGDGCNFVKSCKICSSNKGENVRNPSLLQPLPIPAQKYESVIMAFIIGLPKITSNYCIYVVLNCFTEYVHFFAIFFELKLMVLFKFSNSKFTQVTGILDLWVNFGRNCPGCQALLSPQALVTIIRQMGNSRLLIENWKDI
jgi:hypothetical protein